jgi:hypothetical protein
VAFLAAFVVAFQVEDLASLVEEVLGMFVDLEIA